MTGKPSPDRPPTNVFSVLSDPVRWSIIAQMAEVDELACVTLEDTLPVAKPTISYHVKILQNAGLIAARKEGRNYYYSLRRDVIEALIGQLWALAPGPRPVTDGRPGPGRVRRAAGRVPRAPMATEPGGAAAAAVSLYRAVNDDGAEEGILTW
jgi:DNA-binding transcriptional ArsR family regulator